MTSLQECLPRKESLNRAYPAVMFITLRCFAHGCKRLSIEKTQRSMF